MTESERELPVYMGNMGAVEGRPHVVTEIYNDSIQVSIGDKTSSFLLTELPKVAQNKLLTTLRRIFRKNTLTDFKLAEQIVEEHVQRALRAQQEERIKSEMSFPRRAIAWILSIGKPRS